MDLFSEFNITVIRSRRKTVSLEVRQDLSVCVRVPQKMGDAQIREIVRSRQNWIRKHQEEQRQKQAAQADVKKLTMAEIRELAARACEVIPKKAAFFAAKLHVSYGRITIRNQKTRWGSCSAKGNLNFNCLLMLAPDEVVDYVVVHELCHRIEMNHSKAFWELVERVLPDYRSSRKWLKEHGEEIIRRM